MSVVVPYVSEVLLLKYMVSQINAGNPVLHLFSNNITPNPNTAIPNQPNGPADLSVSGYAPITLTAGTWTVATVSGTSMATYPTMTFSVSAACTAYGYYISDTAGTSMLYLESFTNGPYIIPGGGGQIAVYPSINLSYQ